MTKLFLSFLEISLPVSGLIVLLLLLTPVFDKRYAARWKYWIWIVLAVRLLIPFGGNGGTSPAGRWTQRETMAVPGSAQTVPEPSAEGAVRGRVTVELPAQMTAPIAALPEKTGKGASWLDVIVCVWVSGSVYMLVIPLASYLFFQHRLCKRGSAVKDEAVLCLLQRLKGELQIRGAVSIMEYPDAASPMLAGFSNPVIVLPKAQYSAEELYFILKHELIHLKRGDLYVKLLFTVVRAVHWFNPLSWVMQKEAAVDMELSCDEQVIQDSGYAERKAYTEALFSAIHRQNAQKIMLSTNFYGGKQIMEKRFRNILAKTGKKSGAAVLACAVVLAVSLGTLVGCSVTPGSPSEPGPSAPPDASATSGPVGGSGPSDAANMQAGSVQSGLPLQGAPDAAPLAMAFVPGMGCSDPTCTDAAHHHDCPADCTDYEHHHTCALDCTEAGHHHGQAATDPSDNPGSSGNPDSSGNSGGSGASGSFGNSSSTGSTGGHHNESGHHSGGHHG